MVTTIIITYNLDSRIFILQIEAIRKFCKDENVIEVVDNSSNPEYAEAIRYHSEILGVSYTKTYSIDSNSSSSHSFAANLSYERFKGNGSSHFFFIDHDCIPFRPYSVVEILGDKVLAGIAQNVKHTYIWPGCFMFKKIDEIDFSPDHEKNLDTGGGLHLAVEKYGKDNCVFFSESYHQNRYYQGPKYNHYAIINGIFLHGIAMSNWINLPDAEARVNSLVTIIEEKISEYVD